jgi:hypothetical protein
VIKLISTSFVPVALNHFELEASRDEAGDFFRSVYQQKPQYQGIWLVAPDGQVLTASVREGTALAVWPKLLLEDLRSGMKEFGAITPRRAAPTNPHPYRGIALRPDGGITLAVADREIFVKDLPPNLPLNQVQQLRLDSVTLSAAERLALAPPDARVGSQWTIPEAVGRRFFPLLNATETYFRDPGEVTEVQLVGRVVSARDGIASIDYRGRIAGTHYVKKDGKNIHEWSTALKLIGGVGTYDIQAGQLLSLTWVWDGRFILWNLLRTDTRRDSDWSRVGIVVDWRQERPQAETARAGLKRLSSVAAGR